jgi:iron(III) transport system permease protein
MDNRVAAAQLATALLAVVGLLLWLEHRAQRRLRFATLGGARAGSVEAQPMRLSGRHALLAWLVCCLPVLAGFVLPVLFMLRPLLAADVDLPWDRFGQWAFNSARLGVAGAALAIVIALALAFALRQRSDPLTRGVVQLTGLGYAVPGAVIVVGLLAPVGALQARWPDWPLSFWVTGTVLGVVWAYLVRFMSVALQSVQAGYARIPTSVDDSARMLGVSGLRLLVRVHWPLLQRSVLAGALLVLVDVMKELPATLVLRPFDTDTLAVVAYQLARDERLGEAALPSLALVLVGLVPVMLLSRTLRDKAR